MLFVLSHTDICFFIGQGFGLDDLWRSFLNKIIQWRFRIDKLLMSKQVGALFTASTCRAYRCKSLCSKTKSWKSYLIMQFTSLMKANEFILMSETEPAGGWAVLLHLPKGDWGSGGISKTSVLNSKCCIGYVWCHFNMWSRQYFSAQNIFLCHSILERSFTT